ncbi:MAG: hypothetical protein WBA57_08770 [Elainellaceae cyanobacterium]
MNPGSGGAIQSLYTPGELTPYDVATALRYTGILRSLRCKIQISSLEAAPFPDIDVIQSRQERLMNLRAVEWQSSRYELEIVMRNSAVDWLSLFRISLLNREPYYHSDLMPYLTNEIEYLIAPDCELGARFVDAGYGLPSGADDVTLFGFVKEEMDVLPSNDGIPTQSASGNAAVDVTPVLVLPARPDRKLAVFVNMTDDQDVFLSYGTSAETLKGIPLMRGGGTHEINFSNLWLGQVSAIATGPATVTTLEGW